MWMWVLSSFNVNRLTVPIGLALAGIVLSTLSVAGLSPEEARARPADFGADNTWQMAQVMPRRKPGDEAKPAPAKNEGRPTAEPENRPAAAPQEKPEDSLPREKPAVVPPESTSTGSFVWNERDLAAQGKQQAVLGIVIKILAGALLALSLAMVFWTLSWRSGAVFVFAFAVWVFEFRSIIAGFDIAALDFLGLDHAPLALMGLAATLMVNTVMGRHLPRIFRLVLFFGFGGIFLGLLAAGFFIPEGLPGPTRFVILAAAIFIPVVVVMTRGRGLGRSFSLGLLGVFGVIVFSAISPVLINTSPGAPPLLWLHVIFLVAAFFIIIPVRLSNAYGENFPLPNPVAFDIPRPSSSAGRRFFGRKARYEEPEPEYENPFQRHREQENDLDSYESDWRPGGGYEDDHEAGYDPGYESVDETLENEDRYALGIAAAHQGIWDWNIEYDELYLSPSVDGMLGLATGGLIRSEVGWAERIHPDDFDAYRNALRTYLRRGNVAFDIEFRIQHENGDYIWMQLRATCLPDDDGIAARCIGTVADITQSKASEERLLRNASVDPLTGLMNRSALTDRLNETLQASRGAAVQPGLIVIDLDRFKTVNDSLGHAAGDRKSVV